MLRFSVGDGVAVALLSVFIVPPGVHLQEEGEEEEEEGEEEEGEEDEEEGVQRRRQGRRQRMERGIYFNCIKK